MTSVFRAHTEVGGLADEGFNNANIGLQLVRLTQANRAILCNEKVLYPAN